jgi:hypothetical protein
VLLLVGHGWKTSQLFGPVQPLQALLDERPIVSGQHALHLYHGYLGAQSLQEQGTFSCYDPAFQAGYPKTPVFDCGSRPAELFLSLTGSDYRPSVYKVGVAACVLVAPLIFWLGAYAAGLSCGGACLATLLATMATWSTGGTQLLLEGDLNTFLAGLAALLECGMLLQFARRPALGSWLGLSGACCLVWFADPFIAILLILPVLVYYASVGTRHSCAWHGALLAALAAGVVANLYWLTTWFSSWWIRMPLSFSAPLLAHRTPRSIWEAAIWGNAADRLVTLGLVAGSVAGIVAFNQCRERAAARLFGIVWLGMFCLAGASVSFDQIGSLGTGRFLTPTLWFAAVLSANALEKLFRQIVRACGCPWRATLLVAGSAPVIAFVGWQQARTIAGGLLETPHLQIGLDANDKAIVAWINEQTTPEARILWEDAPGADSRLWSPLLAAMTDRSYIGGLDPWNSIEHSYASLVGGKLAGRDVNSWADPELNDFLRIYNIGWIVCRNSASMDRFAKYPGAVEKGSAELLGRYRAFEVPHQTFALVGKARVLRVTRNAILLADVIPEDGQVLLSFHHQAGMRASPTRVQVERAPDPDDPIPFLRLRLTNPVARLKISCNPR